MFQIKTECAAGRPSFLPVARRGGGGGCGAGEEVGERERESYVENVRDVF